MDLTELGFTKEEIEEKLLARMSSDVLRSLRCDLDEDGEEHSYSENSPLAKKLEERIRARIDKKVEEVAEEHLLPRIIGNVESFTLQATNKWGEKKGEPLTFVEYLVKKADDYIRESVDYDGKAKGDKGSSYQWKGTQTRISHLIHNHLHYSIESAIKKTLVDANSILTEGIAEAAKIKLSEISDKLKITVKT